MRTSNRLIINIVLLVIFLSLSTGLVADPPDPGGDPPEPGGGAPIGDGIIVLIIASVAYLSYYMRELLHGNVKTDIWIDKN